MKRFFIIGGQCPRRRLDVQTIKNFMIKNKLEYTSKISKADIIIVYTCGSFNKRERESLRTIEWILKKKSKKTKVVVTGCLPKINPLTLNAYNGIEIIARNELQILDSMIDANFSFCDIPDACTVDDIPYLKDESALEKFLKYSQFHSGFFKQGLKYLKSRVNGNKRFFDADSYQILVSRGCLGKCSYCAIKYGHGKLRSKPLEAIIDEFKTGLSLGYTRFVLLAADVGCYGIDIKTTLPNMLNKIFRIDEDYQIEFSGINPLWLIKYFDELMPLLLSNQNKIFNLRIPIQSGSNRILRLMKRGYDIDEVKLCLNEISKKMPELAICTHIIVGFPGETDEDYEATCQLLKQFKFDHLALYLYDDRPMTESYKMPNKIHQKIIKNRACNIIRMTNH
jgi:tRNA A37 methylthiotransferase MiaB